MILVPVAFLLRTAYAQRKVEEEIPITTSSNEARELLMKGRDLAENSRLDESRIYFEKAIAQDPTFAMAYTSPAIVSRSPNEGLQYLYKAVALADKISPAERLSI